MAGDDLLSDPATAHGRIRTGPTNLLLETYSKSNDPVSIELLSYRRFFSTTHLIYRYIYLYTLCFYSVSQYTQTHTPFIQAYSI